MADGFEHLLSFCRDVYSDNRDRHARTHTVAVGLLAFNSVLMGFFVAALWRVAENPTEFPPTYVWCVVPGAACALAAIVLDIWVATKATLSWPDTPKLCESAEDQPEVAEPLFLARIYAEATRTSMPTVTRRYELVAWGNVATVIAVVLLAVGSALAALGS